jgi:hypothetical protein
MFNHFMQKTFGSNSIAVLFISAFLFSSAKGQSQDTTLAAGPEYNKSSSYTKKWGKHYRTEWTTPVKFRIALLDTLKGGLIPYEIGGSRQTVSIKLHDKNNREYVLRSVDKSYGAALPESVQGGFIEKLANDQVSSDHPYGALTIAPLAEAIHVYHTNPEIFYIPKQPLLNRLNDSIGDQLFLLEQRPDEDWQTAPNFGNSTDIKSTEKTIEKLQKDHDNTVDQRMYLRARYLDMIIGDWGRHPDQWRWAEQKTESKNKLYQPVPRDRDQAYSVFDGSYLKFALRIAAPHLEGFAPDIKDIVKFNYPARDMDRLFLNGLTWADWQEEWNFVKDRLTDEVIDRAMKNLPPEIYPVSGLTMAATVKSRRDKLYDHLPEYYQTIAEEVGIPLSKDKEYVEIKRLSDDSTLVNVYKISKKGKQDSLPYYSRRFYKSETSEIRIYGIGGEDKYHLTGNTNRGINIRLIGGPDSDMYTDESLVSGTGHKTEIYDDRTGNQFKKSRETQLHLSSDSSVHDYEFSTYKFDKKKLKPIALYSNADRIYVGLAYRVTKNKWRVEPFATDQRFDIKYSITQNAFSATYQSQFKKMIGNLDGVFYANYDFMRWINFYGLGNDTRIINEDVDFNRMRTRYWIADAGLQKRIKNKQKISFHIFGQGIDLLEDTARFIAKTYYPVKDEAYQSHTYVGTALRYVYQSLNDSILPTRGFGIQLEGNYTHSLQNTNRSFARFISELNFYAPFSKKFGLAIHGGAETVTGNPEFYQYPHITSSVTLRGFRRERFWGQTAAYAQNELRFITPVKSYLISGRFGFFGFYDVGRVWIKNENSNTLHSSYGGGIILSPFNLITGQVSVATSQEATRLHLSLIKVF